MVTSNLLQRGCTTPPVTMSLYQQAPQAKNSSSVGVGARRISSTRFNSLPCSVWGFPPYSCTNVHIKSSFHPQRASLLHKSWNHHAAGCPDEGEMLLAASCVSSAIVNIEDAFAFLSRRLKVWVFLLSQTTDLIARFPRIFLHTTS